jgi:hypothetical protein
MITQLDVMNKIRVILKDYTNTTYTDNSFHFQSYSYHGKVEVTVDENMVYFSGYLYDEEFTIDENWKSNLSNLMKDYIDSEMEKHVDSILYELLD